MSIIDGKYITVGRATCDRDRILFSKQPIANTPSGGLYTPNNVHVYTACGMAIKLGD